MTDQAKTNDAMTKSCIRARNIDQIDEINKSKTLEGITYYQITNQDEDEEQEAALTPTNKQQQQPKNLLLMKKFCENDIDYHRRQLLEYFDEIFDPSECKGMCDNCTVGKHKIYMENKNYLSSNTIKFTGEKKDVAPSSKKT